MAEARPAVSFIGLGAMGFGMATNLVKRGYPVTGFDVYAPTLERFQAAGGLTAASVSATVSGKDYCVCMVATAQQAQAVLLEGNDPAVKALPHGAVLFLASTVPCAYVQGLARQLDESGRGDILLVDCPVSGGAVRAAEGTLSIMAGGSVAAIDKGRGLLSEMAAPSKLYIVDGGVGAGSNMKMCHQVLAANHILGASEAMGFASRLGLGGDLSSVQKAVVASDATSWMFENRTPRMLDNFRPLASAVTIIAKDTSIITSEARRSAFPAFMTSVAEQQYFTALDRGYGPDDDSSLLRLYLDEQHGQALQAQGAAGSNGDKKVALVLDLLRGIHLCAAAETLAFARRVDLELEQVLEVCIKAAGNSTMLMAFGPSMIKVLRGEAGVAEQSSQGLSEIAKRVREAVDEAQRLKCPIPLGAQALNLITLALQTAPAADVGAKDSQWSAGARPASLVNLWLA